MFSLVPKSLHKGGVIAKIVDGFERAVLLLSPFQFCGSSSQKQLKIRKILLLWKAEASQSLTEFCWTWWELGTQRCCVTYFFHTFVSIFFHPLTHAVIVPPGTGTCGVRTGVYRWEENRFYSLCWHKHFKHLQTKLTRPDKRGNIQHLFCMLNFELQDFIGKILMR